MSNATQLNESTSKYPEHKKLRAVAPDSQKLGEFLEWLEDKGWLHDDRGDTLPLTIEKVLAEYFDIDLDVIAKEKDAMVEELRRANEEKSK